MIVVAPSVSPGARESGAKPSVVVSWLYPVQHGDSQSLGFVLERSPPFDRRQVDVARRAGAGQSDLELLFGEYVDASFDFD
jgi:hypothetical protein